ncbi:hypothetical protein H0H92_013409 [Tricholoma furcatifolium]|nr:hypothetical protein H0H92_013409 [Tricholoma furcatifolium]
MSCNHASAISNVIQNESVFPSSCGCAPNDILATTEGERNFDLEPARALTEPLFHEVANLLDAPLATHALTAPRGRDEDSL